MSTLGRISNSIFSGTNENTLALASINVDFSLLKFEAPREYAGLGTALSHRRRQDAEEGPLHQTARKLGALFEKKIPSAPSLVKAYGSRASAIFETPGVNPQGSRSDGAFESFVGADGTSIWAAATSGSAAIAMHLLACMLARMWPAKEATSIWAELLIERKREIEVAAKQGDVSSMTISLAGALSLSRDELRLWDASARSWLQSADAAKFSEQKRLELILKNVNVPVASGTSTYKKVISAWAQAMSGLELLIAGVPQRICDGGILVALTAWHIFPDLLVLGQKTVNVQFRDPLIPRSGVITIGLHSSLDEEKETGIKWSLALSHLCYYGDPVEVASDELKSRVTMEQLQLVAFGSLLRLWGFPSHEANLVARWLATLWTHIQKARQSLNMAPGNEKGLQRMSWLRVLVLAAQKLLDSHAEELEINLMLVKWGYRRGRTFLGAQDSHIPLFGLSSLPVLSALTETSNLERDIKYLREVAKLIGASSDDSIITVRQVDTGSYVLVTAVPHTTTSQKRSSDGEFRETTTHARWVSEQYDGSRTLFCTDCEGNCDSRCACAMAGFSCDWRCHNNLSNDQIHCRTLRESLTNRFSQVASRAELSCMHVNRGELADFKGRQPQLEWRDPPLLYAEPKSVACGPSLENQAKIKLPCNCFDRSSAMRPTLQNPDQIHSHSDNVAYFDTIVESSSHSALHLRRCMPSRYYPTIRECLNSHNANCNIERATEWITRLDPSSLLDFLDSLAFGAESTRSGESSRHMFLYHGNFLPPKLLWSLQALSISHRLYESLPGATIPLKVTSQALCEANWIERSLQSILSGTPTPRSNAFSCICMFETGTLNISPSSLQSVMAMSSIYISAALLSDPVEGESTCDDIKRITGNVGFAGIVMMIPPQQPRVRKLGDDFRAVQHAHYNFQREDNFEGTTLHLSFTEWKLPLDIGSHGTIEQDVCYIESIISVHDRGDWVADLDILAGTGIILPLMLQCKCTEDEKTQLQKLAIAKRFVSIDCWEELLDAPDGTGVFRARGNWAARRAAVALLAKQGVRRSFIVGPHMPCIQCITQLSEEFLANSVFID